MSQCAGPLDGGLAFLGALGLSIAVAAIVAVIVTWPLASTPQEREENLKGPAITMAIGTVIFIIVIMLGVVNQHMATCVKVQ